MIDVAIIGAGVAGLACARRLTQAGVNPVLFDKGRGVGGRVATRRVDGLQYDHGAQYATAHGEGFAAVLADLVAAGAAAPWSDGGDRSRTVGTPGMSALTKAMGAGLDIRVQQQVQAIRPTEGGWDVRIKDTAHSAALVVVTVPSPQVAGIIGADHPLANAISDVRMDPCLTLMATVRARAPLITREEPEEPLSWIAEDSSKPGRPRSDGVSWVAQANPAFSTQHLEEDPDVIAALMLPLLCDRLGVTADRVTHAAAHRWRYSRVTAALGLPFLRDPDAALYLGGDWCLGPRVEAAWTSGTAIADDILARGL